MDRLICRRIKNVLSGYLDQELDSERNTLIKNHLDTCRLCRNFSANLFDLRRSINNLAKIEDCPQPPVYMADMIISRLPKGDRGIFTDPFMRRLLIGAAVIIVVLAAGVRLNRIFPVSGANILVVKFQGKVEFFQNNHWDPAKLYCSFSPGEVLRTNQGSSAEIKINDRSRVFLKGRSLLEIKNVVPGPEVNLVKGEILVSVNKYPTNSDLVVFTPQAEIKVTGTKFKVRVNDRDTVIEVLEGEVSLTDLFKQEFRINQGEQVKIGTESLSSAAPARLSASEIKTLREEFNEGNFWYNEEKLPGRQKQSIILWREVKE